MVRDAKAGDAILGLIQRLDRVGVAGAAVPAPYSRVYGAYGAGEEWGWEPASKTTRVEGWLGTLNQPYGGSAGGRGASLLPDRITVASSLNCTQFTFCSGKNRGTG